MARPTKTREETQKLFDLLREGNTRRDACRGSGFGETTFTRYMRQEEFREAVLAAEATATNRFVRAIATSACGGHVQKVITYTKRDGTVTVEKVYAEPNPRAAAFWLQHKKPEDWGRDRPSGEDLRNLSDEELLARIREAVPPEELERLEASASYLLPGPTDPSLQPEAAHEPPASAPHAEHFAEDGDPPDPVL